MQKGFLACRGMNEVVSWKRDYCESFAFLQMKPSGKRLGESLICIFLHKMKENKKRRRKWNFSLEGLSNKLFNTNGSEALCSLILNSWPQLELISHEVFCQEHRIAWVFNVHSRCRCYCSYCKFCCPGPSISSCYLPSYSSKAGKCGKSKFLLNSDQNNS